MKEIVLITGSNGEIAKQLSVLLKDKYSLRFLTRKKMKENEFEWDIENKKINIDAFKNVNHIIHLAGAGIAEKRWTKKRKETILSSRIDSANLILNTLKDQNIKIKSFISASAIGYYGSQISNNIYTENDKNGSDFLSKVCFEWEKAADKFLEENIAERVVKIRIGIVLSSSKNGVLDRIKKPIIYYLGASLGSGKQSMPWIHIEDLCRIFYFSLENININGIYNAVSPEHITNKEFTITVAKILKKPIFLPNIPGFILKLIFGETSNLLLGGSAVSSQKLQQARFDFKFSELKKAIKNLLNEESIS